MVTIKPGVDLSGIRTEINLALQVAESVYGDKECTVTSAMDGKHKKHSLHYLGLAIDLRTRHLTALEKKEFSEVLQQRLGEQFDVVLESSHMHLEFDP